MNNHFATCTLLNLIDLARFESENTHIF